MPGRLLGVAAPNLLSRRSVASPFSDLSSRLVVNPTRADCRVARVFACPACIAIFSCNNGDSHATTPRQYIMSTIHQSPMHAIEEHEPFGVETTGPRVLRNENNLRNRVKREGRRATTRTASHQRLYNFVYFASKTAIQLAFRVLSQLPPIAPLPTAPSGSAIDTSAVTHGILVMSDALCAAAEAMFDAIGDECEITLQTTPI